MVSLFNSKLCTNLDPPRQKRLIRKVKEQQKDLFDKTKEKASKINEKAKKCPA